MINIYKKTLKDTRLREIEKIEKGSWVSVINPAKEEIETLDKAFRLDLTVIEDSLDENEISRIEKNGGNFYMIIRFPVKGDAGVITVPALVLISEENIITLCKGKNEIINSFINERVALNTTQKTNFLLKFILEVFSNYDSHLNKILKDIKLKKIKLASLNNSDILFLVQEEETLNDFVSSIVPIINILDKILSGRYITIYEKDKDVIEDLVMDSKQTLELSGMGLKLIRNIREAYSAILTNELNKIIKVLTVVTIVLTIPTVISSLFGMNVPLPLNDNPFAFLIIILTVVLFSLLLASAMKRKKWI